MGKLGFNQDGRWRVKGLKQYKEEAETLNTWLCLNDGFRQTGQMMWCQYTEGYNFVFFYVSYFYFSALFDLIILLSCPV